METLFADYLKQPKSLQVMFAALALLMGYLIITHIVVVLIGVAVVVAYREGQRHPRRR